MSGLSDDEIVERLKNMYKTFNESPPDIADNELLVWIKEHNASDSDAEDNPVMITIDSIIHLEAYYLGKTVSLNVKYNKRSKKFEAKGVGNFIFDLSDDDVDNFIHKIWGYFNDSYDNTMAERSK